MCTSGGENRLLYVARMIIEIQGWPVLRCRLLLLLLLLLLHVR